MTADVIDITRAHYASAIRGCIRRIERGEHTGAVSKPETTGLPEAQSDD